VGHRKTEAKPLLGRVKDSLAIRIIIIALIVIMLAGLYLHFAWHRYQMAAEEDALRLTRSLESLLHVEHIVALASDEQDQVIPDLPLVEHSLVRLVETTDHVYYACILSKQNEGVAVVANSAAANSGAFNRAKCGCEALEKISLRLFETGQSFLTEPISSPCGDWIWAIVPIFAPESKDVAATLALSYSAEQWNKDLWKRMSFDIITATLFLILVVVLLSLRHQHVKLKENSVRLAFQKALYRNVFEQAPIGIVLQGSRESMQADYISINPVGATILGRDIDSLKDTSLLRLTHPEDLKAELPKYESFVKGEINSYSLEKRLIKPDGSFVWVNIKVAGFSGSPISSSMYICLLEDISARKKSEEALRESERSKSVFLSHLPGLAYRCKYDKDWTMEFVSEGCHALTGYAADSLLYNRELSFNDIISPEYRQLLVDKWERILRHHNRFQSEYEIITKSGERKWVLELGQGIFDSEGNVEALEGIVLDISERKKKEHQITFLRERDFLTGLYNRSHMEQEKKRLDRPRYWPLSVVVCDIDGLRMVNDAYGHEEGDRLIAETAKLIQSCLQQDYLLGRIGGGEFMLLLPKTDSQAADRLISDITSKIEGYNRANKNALYAVNLSIGHSTKEEEDQHIEDVLRSAEESLKRKKLLNQNSAHSAIVSSIMATLYAKSQETEEHGQRLGSFCRMIGEKLGLEEKSLYDLQLLSKLHDIGKIGIRDQLLNKPGKLTEAEWREMELHPEIGNRIAMATPQLEHIAGYILHHHERWDGKGYPMGLKGQEIPIIARILTIADAYDAMTEDRVYRKALPPETALEEIERNAGTQFDPDIARLFVELIRKQLKDGNLPT